MLKRISVQHLALGMYLHQFCGSWMDHPFWRTGFVLQDPADLARIHSTTIAEVWIDVSKGLDVASDVATTSPEEAQARLDTDFSELQEMPDLKIPSAPSPAPSPRIRSLAPATMAEELGHAASICDHARQAVSSMFHEARMGRAVDSSDARSLVQEISDSITRHPSALISLARLKTADDYTYMHSVAVCALMVALARQIGLDSARIRTSGMAGLMHDIGKAAIPLAVLNKPGKLTDEEFDIVRGHSEHGYRMLLECGGGVEDEVLDACLHHHEKMDGSGYPHRLPAEQISLTARMTSICDVYDAVTSDRPYKRGWDPAESLRRMAEWTNGHFDPRLFQAFVKSIGIYPVGSLVRLTSGRIGVVMEQAASLVSPRVKVFFSTKSDLRIPPEIVDLAQPGCPEKIVGREDPDKWRFPDLNELWTGMASLPR
ncbi:HDIG domain-containing protein [Paracidovorax valerianellae]|uniref:HDIG domain-containing protein n=1 Tax=Paracidovorax valerianellae TaxID=187868 RepID=A0A1G6Z9P9_9BURK|nr:HD-GYP domain-containing protein [Paracidovorax valerianellae]SDD99013.1 HDIG domain-containing protein [Paracidovorax valerianellae]